ncbi:MAG: TolC family protein, partial [Gemmataceae bacterium]
DQNSKVAQAWERVREACAEKAVAESKWVPDIYMGTAWYRHEGGIQDFPGTLIRSSTGAMFAGVEVNSQFDVRDYAFQQINARRTVWQQRGELSKVTSETVLEAASTYIDLLTARNGEIIARRQDGELAGLLDRARKFASVDDAGKIEVDRILAARGAQKQLMLELREQANAASAKLAYLLGIDPCTEMIPVDSHLVPIDLVDASAPTCQLIDQALTSGPGVQELEGLLQLIQESQERSRGPLRWMPVVGLRMAEGGFGAGAGDQLTWDNRWDLGLQARWNLTEFVTLKERRRVAEAKMQQAHLAYQDLRGKLAAGVQASRHSIISGRDQIKLGAEQKHNANRAYQLSKRRYNEDVKGSSASEVMLALRSVALAEANYLKAVAGYNKAQIRMLILLGPHY